MLLPLLHAAQSAADLTMVDCSVLASGFAGMLATGVAIWRPGRWSRLNPLKSLRARRRIVGLVGGMMVFVAVVPLAAPIDHIFIPHAESEAHEEIHTAHCHNSPGSCSDLPLVSGPGQFLSTEPLIVTPALVAVLLLFAFPMMHGITHRPEIPPPLARVAAA